MHAWVGVVTLHPERHSLPSNTHLHEHCQTVCALSSCPTCAQCGFSLSTLGMIMDCRRPGGQGGSLVPPYTLGNVSLSLAWQTLLSTS